MLFRPAQQLEVISTGLLGLGIIGTVPIMSRWKTDKVAKAPCKTYVSYSRRQPGSFSGVKMTALSQPTAIDGYRWLKNDIIRGTYQPDEKLRMSLLTARYALGVGPLREALSQLVAERLVTVVNQKAIAWHPCQRRNSSIFLTRAPIWKRCWYARRLNAAMMRGRRRSGASAYAQ